MASLTRDRAVAAAGAVTLQLLLGYALLTGFAVSIPARVRDEMVTFGIALPPPPTPPPPPMPVQRSKADSGKAAPPARKAHATEVVAPVTVPLPTRLPAAPRPGIGADVRQGAAPVAGPGSGAGGAGSGTGSGGSGRGEGAGGTPAEWISGEIRPGDYPHDAFQSRREGVVGLRFVVGVSGRVTDCAVTRSSGDASLDAATCRIILKRFRYHPALDASGRPIPDVVIGEHDWHIALPPPESDDDR